MLRSQFSFDQIAFEHKCELEINVNTTDAQMTKGAWTSRAYDRTKRAAVKEGKSVEEASQLGRAAYVEAAQQWELMLASATDLD